MRHVLLSLTLLGALLRPVSAQCPAGTPPPCRPASARPQPAPPRNSVAVLYFENNSPDTADTYLAEGLTDELITQLGRVTRLAVAPRSAVRRYRGQVPDPEVMARGLGVSHVVTGSVRRAGPRLRVDVELVRLPSSRLWGESYQRGDGDLFAIQEDIARAITREVTGTLLPDERSTLARAPTRDPVAYDLYLRGSRSLGEVNPAAVSRVMALFDSALARDPSFTAARGRLAFVYGWAANWRLPVPGVPADSVVARGLALADRALREDSTASDAWLGRGFALFFRDPPDYQGALSSSRRAVSLDSTNTVAGQNLGVVLRRLGRYVEAEQAYRRTINTDPTANQSIADMGFIEYSRRRYAQARVWYDSAITQLPTAWNHYAYRSRARLALGDTAGARADARTAAGLADEASRHLVVPVQAVVEGFAGDSAAARALMEPIMTRFASGPLSVRDGYELVAGLVAAGQHDRALEALERIRPRGAWLWSYLVFRDFDAVRATPRFQAVYREARPADARDPAVLP